jgi:Na+-driven multidrug efflux pump
MRVNARVRRMADVTQRPRQQFDRSIVEGPIGQAVWRLAWPTMLQNVIAGLQGIIDHVMVGHFVGYTANAAIGVSWQIIIVVIVFISSLFTGMAVLVARFAGANEPEKVNRVVYQAILTSFALSVLLASIGYFASPALLGIVKAAPEVQHQALPFLRTMFVGIFGMMMFFMLSRAFRAAGDARTPLRLGIIMTVLTIAFNVMLIPAFGTLGVALGTIASSTIVAVYGVQRLFAVGSRHGYKPRLGYCQIPLSFRIAGWSPGYRHEHRWRSGASVYRIIATQCGGSGGLRRRLFGIVFADHLDLCRAYGRLFHHRWAESRRWES